MQYANDSNRCFGRITNVLVKEDQLFCTLAVIRLIGSDDARPAGDSLTDVCPRPRNEILDQILAICDYGKHFRVVEETEDFLCIRAEQIVGHCLLLPFGSGNKTFLTTMPLHFEHS